MKKDLLSGITSLIVLSAVFGVTGCGTNQPGGFHGTPGSLAPGNQDTDTRELVYQNGFQSGRRDATSRLSRNHTRYQALYNLRTAAQFRKGYAAGFTAHSTQR